MIVLACVAGIVALGFLLSAPPPQSCRLGDGSTLTLRRVTYGKAHSERLGSRMRDYLVGSVPDTWAGKLGCARITMGRSNALTFWFERTGDFLPEKRVSAEYPGKARHLRAVPFDDHGCQFPVEEPMRAVFREPTRELDIFEFDQFPRREKIVRIALFQSRTNGGFEKAGEFKIRNPDERTFPVWQAEPLPIAKKVGKVEFTLLEMKGGVYGSSFPPQMPVLGENWGTFLKFQITEDGRPSSDWYAAPVANVFDGCGNIIRGGGGAYSRENQVISGGLCLEESACRVEGVFVRNANFPAEDLWIIRDVLVPEEKAVSAMDLVTNLHGAEFRFLGVAGKDAGVPGQQSIMSTPVARVFCRALPKDCELKLITAEDWKGRNVIGWGTAGQGSEYVFGLNLKPDSKSVDLTFAVTKRVTVEFLAQPSRMTEEQLKKLRKQFGFQ